MTERMTCDERFIALAQELNYDIYGENTDGLGLVTDLVSNAGFELQGRRILLIGAGGASAGVLGPLLTQKPLCIWVANRTLDKATQLVARHASLALAEGVDCQAFGLTHEAILSQSFDLVINASSSSRGRWCVVVFCCWSLSLWFRSGVEFVITICSDGFGSARPT